MCSATLSTRLHACQASRATVDALPSSLRARTRSIASVSVKGKTDDVAVCEVLWQEEDDLTMTVAALSVSTIQAELAHQIVLRHDDAEITLDASRPSVAMGKSASATAPPKAPVKPLTSPLWPERRHHGAHHAAP